MTNLELSMIIAGTLIIIFLLLFFGKYYQLKAELKSLQLLLQNLQIKLQDYCDVVPYTVEAYKLLVPNDLERIKNLISLKKESLDAKNTDIFMNIYKKLNFALIQLFDLRHKDTKIAHDLRFLEAFTQHNHCQIEFEKSMAEYTELKQIIDSELNRGLGLIVKRFL